MAQGWIDKGDLERAAAAVASDSTVDGLALRGRIQLFRGDIRGAADHLRFAGPFAGQRDAAVSRTIALSLIQVIEADSLPALGAGLLALERRDSVAAVRHLEAVAAALPPERGGAEVLLLVGRVQIGLRNVDEAERLFGVVAELGVPASAAQAELELARLHLAKNRQPLAIDLLEHLLVTYPASAVVPQARRLLDVAKGAVPPFGEERHRLESR
jgi:hypothetical protein